MQLLLLVPIVGPLLAAVALLAAWRPLVAHPRRDEISFGVTLAVVTLTALCVLALLPHADSDLALQFKWLPGSGEMALGLGATGLYAALVTTGGCALALLGTRSEVAARSCPLTLLALAAAHAAFLAEHFLARYVALEIVALCVALAPLAELPSASGVRLSPTVYLILRLGDVGLLVAILMLWAAGGTLDIAAALEAGKALDPARLNWLVAGFLLAVWVKLGGWPLHIWQQAGRRLTLFSHSWLYASLMPNLGLYLLYRVTPLLALAAPLATAALWIGSATAALAAVMALAATQAEVAPSAKVAISARERAVQVDVRSSLVYLGAAQGGLALVLAASGVKTGVWLTLLILTPLRLLLYLAGDTGSSLASLRSAGRRLAGRRLAAGLFALGGLALTATNLLITWWARQAGASLDALLVAEFAVALIGIWAARVTWQIWQGQRIPAHPGAGMRVHWTRWASVAMLGGGVLAGGLTFGALARNLAAIGHSSLLAFPTPLLVLRYVATTPAFLIALVVALATWRLRWRLHRAPLGPSEGGIPTGLRGAGPRSAGQAFSLEEGLTRAAQILSAVVETGIQERIIGGAVRAVLGGARTTRRLVEKRILEGTMNWIAQTAVGGGQLAYRVLEQDGLEGLLRRTVRTVLAASRWMQRQHTGRLRRNLLWVTASLVLVVLALVLLA